MQVKENVCDSHSVAGDAFEVSPSSLSWPLWKILVFLGFFSLCKKH